MDPATSFRRLVPVSKLQEFITPVESVYVLKRLRAQEVTAVIECFGNPLEPSLPTRRAANVTWRGVRLADLLVRGGVKHEASDGNTPTWQRFAFNWVATRGTHEIRCRAADSRGRIQLTEGRNSMHAITVTIG
jgi:hypothetical protein